VVTHCLYGDHQGSAAGLTMRAVPYVVTHKPFQAWWTPVEAIGAVWEVAAPGG
jgi:hypothetical protein